MVNEAEIVKFLEVADEEMARVTNISHFEKFVDENSTLICQYLTNTIKNQLQQECDAYVIGPRAMGLSEGKSDITIFLDIGQCHFFAERVYKDNMNEIKRVENVLKRDRNWQIMRFNRALPSLSVLYKPSNQRCDLSITNGFSVQISAMIGHFFEIQPEAIKFYHFIRIWLKINGVSFKQFTLTLLVMNFLQENNLMPSAFKAQKNVPQNFIEGIPVSFDQSRDICSYQVKKMVYYYAHVRDFFRYYANFNFKENVISTFFGYPVQKKEYQPKLDYDSPMCIAAFLNQKCNVSRYVTDHQLFKFQSVCDASYRFMAENNY